MKSLIKIAKSALCATALLSMSAVVTSCEDVLDTKPQGVFTDEQLTENEAMDLMVSAYASLLNHFFGNNEAFAGPITNWIMDVRSDDAIKGGGELGMEGYIHQLEMGNVQSDNATILNKWRNSFYAIARCNKAIRAIEGAEKFDANTKASYAAEMRTLRSFFYFELYRLFERFPYFDETVELPSKCRADEYTREEILNFIRTDLRESYKVLPETQSQAGRFNRYVAAAILARVDVFVSDWAEAEEYADYVISSGQYELYNNFLDLSKPEFNNQFESVLAIQFSSANSPDQYNFSNCLNCTYSDGLYGVGDDFYLASQNLVDAFRTDADGLPYLDGDAPAESVESADYSGNVDPRLDFTVGRLGMPWRGYTYTEKWVRNMSLYGPYSGKKAYTSPTSPYCETQIVPWGASSLNFILIRYADVLLMKAEALIEQNKNLGQAREIINSIRSRANRSVDPSYAPIDCNPMVANYAVGEYSGNGWTQDYARKAVRHERRVELAMEGLRWFDLVRWGNVVETVNAYYRDEVKFHPYYQGAALSSSSVFFPIPLDQVDNSGDLYIYQF